VSHCLWHDFWHCKNLIIKRQSEFSEMSSTKNISKEGRRMQETFRGRAFLMMGVILCGLVSCKPAAGPNASAKSSETADEQRNLQNLRPHASEVVKNFGKGPGKFDELAFGSMFMAFLQNPNEAELFWDLSENASFGEASKFGQAMLAKVRQDPEIAEMMKNRYMIKLDVAELAKKPHHTVGGMYGQFMQKNKLDPNFFPIMKGDSDLVWFINWTRKIHDLMHMTAGYSAQLSEEVGWQAFYTGNIGSHLGMTVVSVGLLHISMHYPHLVGEHLEMVNEAFKRGKNAKNLASIKWDKHWDTPVEEIRKMARLTPRMAPVISNFK
jgi:ubiquinone biosynthesis protein Coq4